MGPVFYLVQCEEARCLISAVILGNWPHEFALAPSPGKGGCALGGRWLCLQRLSPSAEACGAREKSLARNSRHLTVRALLLCAVSDQVVDLLRRQLRQIGTSNR